MDRVRGENGAGACKRERTAGRVGEYAFVFASVGVCNSTLAEAVWRRQRGSATICVHTSAQVSHPLTFAREQQQGDDVCCAYEGRTDRQGFISKRPPLLMRSKTFTNLLDKCTAGHGRGQGITEKTVLPTYKRKNQRQNISGNSSARDPTRARFRANDYCLTC